MEGQNRRAAAAAYKERKVEAGIYAVRCSASGQIWVGAAPDLSTIQNRLWFTLRQGGNSHASLQEAWIAHGSETFTFETIESLADQDTGYIRNAVLKRSLSRWSEQLGAVRI